LFGTAWRHFWRAVRRKKKGDRENSSYRALCTALSATVGTGNLVGVAGAIAIGGPGAVFWMWVCGVLGMVIKFAEASLAVRYAQKLPNGETVGGPMYMIRKGMPKGWHWLAGVYCFFGIVAAFGVGNATQINAVVGSVNSVISSAGGAETRIGNLVMGCALAVLVGAILLGGAKRIGQLAERLVPFAAVFYIILGLGVLLLRMDAIPMAFQQIIRGAFSPNAVTGGAVGSVFTVLRVGASRGVFTNEAGMGTAAIAHASAKVEHPVRQGLMGIMEVFLDTIVICTVTALVILCSGVQIPYGTDMGIALTAEAFSSVYGAWVCVPISLALCSFAIATVLGWGLYGGRCAQYIFGEGAWRRFVCVQIAMVVLGAVMQTGAVWLLSETVNGLMAVPNLIMLAYLSPELVRLVRSFREKKVDKPAQVM